MTSTKTQPKNQGYRLVRPCAKCPFRTDVEPYIRPAAAKEIAASLREGGEFPCHETTVYSEPENDETDTQLVRGPDSQFCAGALITMEKDGFANQMMRISERIGIYDASRLDMSAPVSDSLSAWVKRFFADEIQTAVVDGEEIEYEHCGVVGPDCVDPAGFMTGGGAAENDEPPQCHPVNDVCNLCGHSVCSECRQDETDEFGQPICIYCVED